MTMRGTIVSLTLAVICAAPAPVQESAKPTVVILTTGGTIASRVGAPMTEGDSLVSAVPQLLDHAGHRLREQPETS